ncbi:MAG: hypothetical protein LH613_07060 [Chamaesiphon sp.]|nr:hypothetical protein [Chamaesiphon sp.]
MSIAPMLILLGYEIDLDLNLFEIMTVRVAVIMANLIGLDSRSNWLEGILLLAISNIMSRCSD